MGMNISLVRFRYIASAPSKLDAEYTKIFEPVFCSSIIGGIVSPFITDTITVYEYEEEDGTYEDCHYETIPRENLPELRKPLAKSLEVITLDQSLEYAGAAQLISMIDSYLHSTPIGDIDKVFFIYH